VVVVWHAVAEPGVDATPHEGGFRASVSLLRRNHAFRRLFLASVISLGGDWFLFVAIGGLILDATDSATSVGLAILCQEFAFFLASPFAGALADRLDRRKLMIGCDVARALICVAFLAVGEGTVWLAYPLLALLAVFAAPFDPASSAAIPNVVTPEDLPIANALGGSLWGTMLAIGAAVGGVVASVFGPDTAFLVDAASFVVSALLLSGIRVPFSEPGDGDTVEHPGVVEATRETIRYARRDHRVLALVGVKGGFGLAAGVLALIPVFGKRVFDAGDIGFGFLMAARGVGALIGPFIGHRLAGRDHERLLPAIGASLALFGLSYVGLGFAPTLLIAAGTILLAHLGGGSQWVLSTYGLQRIVPDHIRGRIFAFDFALVTLSLAVSSYVASVFADHLGPREAAFILGGVALAWAAVWWVLSRRVRRTPIFEGCGEAPEEDLPAPHSHAD
jgi:MFS family permease